MWAPNYMTLHDFFVAFNFSAFLNLHTLRTLLALLIFPFHPQLSTSFILIEYISPVSVRHERCSIYRPGQPGLARL